MNTSYSKIFVIILIGFCFLAPKSALGQVHHHSHAKIQQTQTPAEEHSPASLAQMKIAYPEPELKSAGWTKEFLDQIKNFEQAVLLYKKATTSTDEDRKIAIGKMVALVKNTAEAERAYTFALDCKVPCKQEGLRAFDKMTELAKQFSDIESILRVTEHSKLESPMIEPDKSQLKIARKKVIEIADTKWQIKYVFQRMPAGSAEEMTVLDKLNTFGEQ